MFENGSLACPSEDSPCCPQDCDICHTYLKLLECSESVSPEEEAILVKINKYFPMLMTIVVTSLVLGIFSLAAYQRRRKRERTRNMKDIESVGDQALLEDDGKEDMWLAPLS